MDLSIYGGEIEVDRRILEEMKDPLIHLVRNGVDHGIETPAEREKAGKPTRGTITIGISARSGSHFELLVTDDGAGMDVGRLKSAAGRADPSAAPAINALSNKDALSLSLQSGISTSLLITDISGRGLGLAIVKKKWSGSTARWWWKASPVRAPRFASCCPSPSRGSTASCCVSERHSSSLPPARWSACSASRRMKSKRWGSRETIPLGGQAVSLVRLRDILKLVKKGRAEAEPEALPVVILVADGQRIAFAADEILREQEVLVKSLGRQLGRVRNIAGATLMEDGRLALVLNTPDLIKSAIETSETSRPKITAAAPSAEARKKSILIAEDSITSRTLLKKYSRDGRLPGRGPAWTASTPSPSCAAHASISSYPTSTCRA